MKGRLGALLLMAILLGTAMPAQPWGNGSSSNSEFRYYGVHDVIAHVALEKLRAAQPEAAAFLGHWFLANPGGYGASFKVNNLKPTGSDNLLGYTDDPDSDFQDWCNHLYMVHPRSGADEQCAPAHVANKMDHLRLNLTLSFALGNVPCNPLEHMAAYNAGLVAHYIGDLSQWGHTDDTRKDHTHPPQDPDDRTYHGYYESAVWGSAGLRALLVDQRARSYTADVVSDPAAAAMAMARKVNAADGATVTYVDSDGRTVSVGSTYRSMLTGYVQAYDSGQVHLGMRGYTPALWAQTNDHVARSVDLVADLWYTSWVNARAAVPSLAPSAPPGLPGCPDA